MIIYRNNIFRYRKLNIIPGIKQGKGYRMSAKRITGRNRDAKNMFIILASIIIAGIAIVLILNFISGSGKAALQEGKDYDLTFVDGNRYQVIDDEGNVIALQKVTPELYKDIRGRSYRFVSGSPYKYIGSK